MADIELFPHNEEGYESLVSSLEDNNLSFIERATGTGKSYILIKYLANFFAGKKVLFVTLHDSMFKQLTTKDMPTLGISKDMFGKMDCILYSSIQKHDAQWYYDNYDCVIFDEAHHCGAPKWGSIIGELSKLIATSSDKKMIGATATGTRYLDDYMDVAKEFFDDNVASKLYLSEAILREILPAPYYINLNHSNLDKVIELKNKLYKLKDYKELDEIRDEVKKIYDFLTSKESVNSLLKKYGVQPGEKYIVFCNNIDEIEKKKKEAVAWFGGIAPLEMYEAHSRNKKDTNDASIESFKKNDNPNVIKLMFAVDMFNEGLHINSVDGILMARHTTSPIIYLQQLGRVLSFSSRKKQVKVFDLVGNATDIDIIYNLYKELLAVARDELAKGNGNSKHYEDIIERFKIVEEGTDIVSKIDSINTFLNNNYFDKEKIRRCIFILTNFVEATKTNFMDLLKTNSLPNSYIKIYNELRKLSDSLTIDDFVQLNKIGVFIFENQNTPELLDKVKKYGNLGEAREGIVRDCFDRFNLFYQKYNRRPNILNPEEALMVYEYRDILFKSKTKVLTKYLKTCSFPLNIEELLLLKDYPSREAIDSYLDFIESKYKGNIELDDLEKESLKRLNKIFSFKDRPILDGLANSTVLRIDNAIRVLQGFLADNPGTKFGNINYYKEKDDIYRALCIIYKYPNYVTDIQFEALINMDIVLPKLLNMSFETRRKMLGNYHSFYEKEVAENYSDFMQVISFINNTGRRPDINSSEEKGIAKKLQRFTMIKSNSWSKKTIEVLNEKNIELTIDEKIVSGYDISDNDLEVVYKQIIDYFNDIDINKYNRFILKRKIAFLKKHDYIDDKLYRIYNRTISFIDYYVSPNKRPDDIRRYLLANQAIIPYSLLPKIKEEYGIKLVGIDRIGRNKKENEMSIAHKRYNEIMSSVDEYFDYIKEHGARPESYTVINKNVENYLVGSSAKDIRSYCDRLSKMGITPNLSELYLAGICSEAKQNQLYNDLKMKRQGNSFGILDRHVYRLLRLKIENKIEEEQVDSFIKDLTKELKDDEFESFKKTIDEDPTKEIDFSNSSLIEAKRQELNDYRLFVLSRTFIPEVTKRIKAEGKAYKDFLATNEQDLLNKIVRICKKNNVNLELVNELEKENKNIIFSSNNIELFVSDYLEFCKKYKKEPDIESADYLESSLARKYRVLKSAMDSEDRIKFEKEVKKSIISVAKIDFYSTFIDFIEKNKRFPTTLSSDESERSLALDFQKIGLKLQADQRRKISQLQKKYQFNTMMYAQKNGGKKWQ